jgi:tetratricopeptide (TPR) repeat protein
LKEELASALTSAAGPLTNSGDYDRAADYYQRAIGIGERFLEVEPHNAQAQRRLFVAYGNYCILLGIPWSANMGRPAEARRYCEKSTTIARDLSATDPLNQTARRDLGVSLGQLGMIDPNPDQVANSLRTLEEALSILDPMLQANTNSATLALRVGLVREYAGRRLQRLGRLSAAADYFRLGLAVVETAIKSTASQGALIAIALGNEEGLAETYAEQGHGESALAYAREAVDRARKYSALTPGRAVPIGHLGEAYFELAWVERTLDDWDRAATDAELARSTWRSIDDKGVLSVHRQAHARTEALALEIAAHQAP